MLVMVQREVGERLAAQPGSGVARIVIGNSASSGFARKPGSRVLPGP